MRVLLFAGSALHRAKCLRFGNVLFLVWAGAALLWLDARAQTSLVGSSPDAGVHHLIEWSPALYSVGELGHSIRLTAIRGGALYLDGTVLVDYAVSGGTANRGLDYELTSGTLRWDGGSRRTTAVSIQIKDDSLIEGTETVRIALRNPRVEPSGAGTVALGTNFEAVVSILDNDYRSGPGQGTDGPVFSSALQSDGKLYISGNFDYVNGRYRPRLARLNPDLSLDTRFDPGTGYDAVDGVHMVPLPDDKLMIGGFFSSVNGIKRQSIARLNSDGSVDQSFNAGKLVEQGSNPAMVTSIVPLPDGKLLIGGTFGGIQIDLADGFYQIINRSGIMLLTRTGELDTFNTAFGALDVFSLLALPDGKVLVFGYESKATGYTFIASRIYPTGGRDTSYRAPTLPPNFKPDVAVLLRDSSVLLSGYNGTVKVRPDGTLDESFQIDAAVFPARMVAQQFDDYLLAASGASFNRIHRDGSIDKSFAAEVNGSVRSIAILPNGRVFIGGFLNSVHNVGRSGFALLDANGELIGGMKLALHTNGPNGAGRLTSLDVSAEPFVLQASENLLDWFPIYTNSPGQLLDFREAAIGSFRHRFYRVVPEP